MKEKTNKIGMVFKLAWTSRHISLSINILLVGYLTYYCTNILLIDPKVVGVVLLASKLLDGLADFVAGVVIDRTRTRWGQARPYQLLILPAWIFTMMIFSVPDMGTTGQLIYIFILYALINSVCATFMNGSDALNLAKCVKEDKDKVSVISFSGAVVMLASIIFSIIMPSLISNFGTTKEGWSMISLLFGIPLGILGLFRFFFCKEIVSDVKTEHTEKVSIKDTAIAVCKNKYVFLLAIMSLLCCMQNGIYFAVSTYYYQYIVGDISLASLTGLVNFAIPVLMIMIPFIIKKVGKVNYLRLSITMAFLGILIRTIGSTNLVTLSIGTLFSVVGIIPLNTMTNIYIVDCMEYGIMKTGKDVSGVISSIISFGKNVGDSVVSGIIGFVMGLAGYAGTLEVQSASANMSIVFLYNFLPLILIGIVLVLSLFYNIDKYISNEKKRF